MNIAKSVEIKCGKEELWAWLTEFEKLRRWNETILQEEHISRGEVKEGYLTKVLIREGKKEIWYDNEIIKYRPYRFLKISLSGGHLGKNPMFVSYDIKELEAGSIVYLNSSWKPSGLLLKLLQPLIKAKATQSTVKVLRALKNQIENKS